MLSLDGWVFQFVFTCWCSYPLAKELIKPEIGKESNRVPCPNWIHLGTVLGNYKNASRFKRDLLRRRRFFFLPFVCSSHSHCKNWIHCACGVQALCVVDLERFNFCTVNDFKVGFAYLDWPSSAFNVRRDWDRFNHHGLFKAIKQWIKKRNGICVSYEVFWANFECRNQILTHKSVSVSMFFEIVVNWKCFVMEAPIWLTMTFCLSDGPLLDSIESVGPFMILMAVFVLNQPTKVGNQFF